jgi:hypothetical protein
MCNRLWSPALVAMLVGAVAAWRIVGPSLPITARRGLVAIALGFGLMAVGNVGEYWFAYGLPHQGGIGAVVRSILWMSVLAGWLVALIAAAIAGNRLLGSRRAWAVALLAPAVLTLLALTRGASFAGLPLGLIGLVLGTWTLATRATERDAPERAPSPSG